MLRTRTEFSLKFLSLCLLTGLLVGCAATSNVSSRAQTGEPRTESSAEASRVVNILLLGVDSWDTLSGRSDAIVMLSVDMERERVLLTSVPRDLRVNLDGLPQPQRINAAYAMAVPI